MTSRERILAAYRRQPVDRVPCSPRIGAWLLDRYGDTRPQTQLKAAEEFGFDPHYNVGAGQCLVSLSAAQHAHDVPGVECLREEHDDSGFRVIRRIFKTPDGGLSDVTRIPPPGDRRYGIMPNPIRTEHLVKDAGDLKRLRHLVADAQRIDFAPYFAAEKAFGERGFVQLNVMSALTHRAGDACAMEDMMVLYYDDRGTFDELLGMFQAEMMAEVRAAIAHGVRHFFANWYYNSLSTGWSPPIWREVFAPQLAQLTDCVHAAGGTVCLYDDGKCMPILELVADAGIDALQTLAPPPVGDVDLADAKRRIGARVCLMGNVDLLYVIQRGTPEQIDRTVRETVEAGAPGGGFVLGTSDSIRDGTPLENVRAYFEAARRYGRAPIS